MRTLSRAISISGLGLIAAPVIIAVALYTPWRHTGPPRIVADKDSLNLGHVKPGSSVVAFFRLSNQGGAVLRLDQPTASCGCTAPSLKVTELGPGAQTELEVRFQVPADPGPLRHSIYVPTNDPANPRLTLTLFAEAWTGVRARPVAVDFGRTDASRQLEQIIQIYAPDGLNFKIEYLEAGDGEFEPTDLDLNLSIPVHRVLLKFRPGAKLGSLSSGLRVTTNRSDSALLVIPMRAEVVGPVTFSPGSLSIDQGEIGKPVRRTLLIRSTSGGNPPVVKQIRVDPPWELLEQHIRAVAGNWVACDLILRFPTGAGEPAGRMEVRVERPEVESRIPLTINGWTAPFPELPTQGVRP